MENISHDFNENVINLVANCLKNKKYNFKLYDFKTIST